MEDFQLFRNTAPLLSASFILLMNFAERWSILGRFRSLLFLSPGTECSYSSFPPGVSNKTSSQLGPGPVMNQRQARETRLENTRAPNLKNNLSVSVAEDGGQKASTATAVPHFPNLQSKPFKLWKHAA